MGLIKKVFIYLLPIIIIGFAISFIGCVTETQVAGDKTYSDNYIKFTYPAEWIPGTVLDNMALLPDATDTTIFIMFQIVPNIPDQITAKSASDDIKQNLGLPYEVIDAKERQLHTYPGYDETVKFTIPGGPEFMQRSIVGIKNSAAYLILYRAPTERFMEHSEDFENVINTYIIK